VFQQVSSVYTQKFVLKQGVVSENTSLCFLSSREVIGCHIERTKGLFLYGHRGTLEIDSQSVGDIFLVRLVFPLWYNERRDRIDEDE
jgi:hypothetical protein